MSRGKALLSSLHILVSVLLVRYVVAFGPRSWVEFAALLLAGAVAAIWLILLLYWVERPSYD